MRDIVRLVLHRLFKQIVSVGTGDLLLRVLLNLELSAENVRQFHIDQWATRFTTRLKEQVYRLREVEFPPAQELFLREADLCCQLLNDDDVLTEDEASALSRLFQAAEQLHWSMHGPEFPLGFRHPLHIDVHICRAFAEVGLNRMEEDRIAEELLALLDGHCSREELCREGWLYYYGMGFCLNPNDGYLPDAS